MSKSKNKLNIIATELQPYSPKELREIAGSIETYRTGFREEYAWTDLEGNVHVEERMLTTSRNEQLHVIAKDLYVHGARKKDRKKGLALQIVGQTFCQTETR